MRMISDAAANVAIVLYLRLEKTDGKDGVNILERLPGGRRLHRRRVRWRVHFEDRTYVDLDN